MKIDLLVEKTNKGEGSLQVVSYYESNHYVASAVVGFLQHQQMIFKQFHLLLTMKYEDHES